MAQLYARFLANGSSEEEEKALAATTLEDARKSTVQVFDSLPTHFVLPPKEQHNEKVQSNDEEDTNDSEKETYFSLAASSRAFFGRKEDSTDEKTRALEEVLVQTEEQELAKYLDMVEQAIVRQLSARSDDFFQAVSNLGELSDLVSNTCARVRRLRLGIRNVQSDAVQGVLRVPRLASRRANAVALHAKLVAMLAIKKAIEAIHADMLEERYATSIGTILAAKRTLDTELNGVKCLTHMARRLDQFYDLAVSYMTARLVNLALASSWKEIESIHHQSQGFQALQVEAKPIASVLEGLARAGKLNTALNNLERRFEEEARDLVGTIVLEYAHENNSLENTNNIENTATNSDAATTKLQALSAAAFERCFQTCAEHLLTHVHCAVSLNNFILNFLQAAADATRNPNVNELEEGDKIGDPFAAALRTVDLDFVSNVDSPLKSPRGDANIHKAHSEEEIARYSSALELETLAAQSQAAAGRLCQGVLKKAARLLMIREDATARAKLRDVAKLQATGNKFAVDIARASGSPIKQPVMHNALKQISKAFLDRQHRRHKNDLATALDSEKWGQVDATPERQAVLDALATGRVILKDDLQVNNGFLETAISEKSKKRELRGARVDGKSHKVVWSAVLLLDMVAEKLAAAATLPLVAAHAGNLVIDLLRFFESRARYLVLSAGALNSSARLRTITARHLGLASQCLSLVVALLPHIRATLVAHISTTTDDDPQTETKIVQGLDELQREYLDHHHRILSKFVSIISEMLDTVAKTAMTDCNSFAANVVKNVEAMHSVLSKLLPPEQLQEVFTNIFDLVATKITSIFVDDDGVVSSVQNLATPSSPKQRNAADRKRIADDLRFIVLHLSKLQAVPTSSSLRRLDTFITEKFASISSSASSATN
eukprot:CAMPEP_0197320750 /NCGR_PEP_ID=MMETSP0891-20130614/61460_1 /TAXON_ID=44058 ORGANISM="Aureoumbra lagunensis, Strain CCMP1510" /NCGR_SAMPLE_ID=MMETSP0891 /ASSEMBLY_ACC=CAM_ASM_000534 /LENGTH=892 /DNA_ID=CAMNT_0042812285 /DNA_START=270 /DNA_END=2948 /DNA_ORIENTATION=-